MNLDQLLETFFHHDQFKNKIIHRQMIAARAAEYLPLPNSLPPQLRHALLKKNITALYSHQSESYERINAGENVVVVTPTASGKTLCYNLPVISYMLTYPGTRALYLFPTKALAQDQMNELHTLINALETPLRTYTFDGDTPNTARQAVRVAGDIVITNPDMLHNGILPHHEIWNKFFECVKYIVIDELHAYRGIFGSQVANVIRRLKRLSAFYGRKLQFICCSATIKNPRELAEKITGEKVSVIDRNGAPRGIKHVLLYNPPVINRELGIRRSAVHEAATLGHQLLANRISTIIFARSRMRVEILLTELRGKLGKDARKVRGYRGGYLPLQRREIEKGLRNGDITGVVSTNALELGIDIGQLDAAIITGYPGSIASLWQQAGRAGRAQATSLMIFIATSSPMDQYLMQNPDYLFQQSPEAGIVNPDNLLILTDHIKCAAYELPFSPGEPFGNGPIDPILTYLTENQLLTISDNRYFWSDQAYPARGVNLRSASPENVTICDIENNNRIIGEVDFFSAPVLLHDQAIYIHESITYQVKKLDWEQKRAFVRPVKSDYYTDAHEKVDIKNFTCDLSRALGAVSIDFGDLIITRIAVMFKKIKLITFENVGWGTIALPEISMPTSGCRIDLREMPASLIQPGDSAQALLGCASLFRELAPIYLFCDKCDINTTSMIRSPFSQLPSLILYDNYPGGIGLARQFYIMIEEIVEHAIRFVTECNCLNGCPSCVGPLEEQPGAQQIPTTLTRKKSTLELLNFIQYHFKGGTNENPVNPIRQFDPIIINLGETDHVH